MKRYNAYIILLGFILSGFLLNAQQKEDGGNPLIGTWKVIQIETLYQDESGAPYRDGNIEKDKVTKDVDLKLEFGDDQLSFIMHEGEDAKSVPYAHGDDTYTITTQNNREIQYQYKPKGKTLVIEKTEENVSVFEDFTVPVVVQRFVLKRMRN